MDLIDIIDEYKCIGQNFLPWLWFKSESEGIVDAGNGAIEFSFVKQMTLESELGKDSEKVVCSSQKNGFSEARLALRNGKKLEQARLILHWNDMKYCVTACASTFELKSVSLPKTAGLETEEIEEVEGMILEKIYLYERLNSMLYELLVNFLRIRLSERWQQEYLEMQNWINQDENLNN